MKLELQRQFQSLRLHRDSGECELGVTNIVFVDFMADGKDELPEYIVEMIGPHVKIATPSPTVFPWVFPAIIADPKEIEAIFTTAFPGSKPEHKMYPKNRKDALQLYAHKVAGRDYFITSDKGILRKNTALSRKSGIKALTLGKYLSHSFDKR
jgi:hypothetical protein